MLPGFCIDHQLVRNAESEYLRPAPVLAKFLASRKTASVCLVRGYALGDLIMLTPVIEQLKEDYPGVKISLVVQDRYKELFRYYRSVEDVLDYKRVGSRTFDYGVMLDGVLEVDHRKSCKNRSHRSDMYARFLGMTLMKHVFRLPISDLDRKWAFRFLAEAGVGKDERIVAIQIKGSTPVKTLPKEKVVRICKAIVALGAKVLLIDHDRNTGWEGTGIINACGKTNVHRLVALLERSNLAVCMDSGVLHLTHCTGTPTVALLGATRPQDRTVYHPDCVAVELNKEIGCESCFEAMSACGGRANCMVAANEKTIIQAIERRIAND
ncbi:MAG: glycosyltransferase family 9 protein [Thermodesulfobacteriota bacterium]